MNRPDDGTRHPTVPWWWQSAGYALYLRSFADSDGDGVGDLDGVTAHLDHLVDLGIDLVWLTPFYPSPMADFGYDVTDHCAVDPTFGDFTRFDHLLSAAHDRGLRIVIDLVANHTSVEHRWFRSALTGRSSPHRDHYVWSDPAPGGGPPNNWVSYFGGSAWTLDPGSGQYYLHLFLADQPDLNWRHPAVRAEFDRILEFWLERGVDGFRVDVAQGLVKDVALRSNPEVGRWDPRSPRLDQWAAFDHRYEILQPESLEVFAGWKAICRRYDAVLIGEASVERPEALARLLRGDGLDVGLWLETMHVDWDAEALRSVIDEPLRSVGGPASIGWSGSSLDEVRAVTRFGGGEQGRRRALALTTLLAMLPGIVFVYQGEELGLGDAVIPPDRRADPVGADVSSSRDGCRAPMPWAPGPSLGFSSSIDLWLPNDGYGDADTVQVQRRLEASCLQRHQTLLRLRRCLVDRERTSPEPWPTEWLQPADQVIGVRRGPMTVLVNVGDRPARVPAGGSVAFCSHGSAPAADSQLVVEPDQAVIVVDTISPGV